MSGIEIATGALIEKSNKGTTPCSQEGLPGYDTPRIGDNMSITCGAGRGSRGPFCNSDSAKIMRQEGLLKIAEKLLRKVIKKDDLIWMEDYKSFLNQTKEEYSR